MNSGMQNIRLAARSLHRWGGAAFVSLAILALGIGLSIAVFTVADALLLRPLPVTDQGRLVVLWGTASDRPFNYPVGLSEGREFVRGARTLERAALFLYNGAGPLPIRDRDQVSRLHRALVSGEFFDVLGVRPVLGRALRRDDDVRGAEPVVVLSYAAWRERFNADPRVIGRQIVTYGDGPAYTIVGVMPQGLDYPKDTDFWAPVVPSMSPDALSLMGFYVIGRLVPGATPRNAGDELTTYLRRADAPPWQRELHGIATLWPRIVIGDVRPAVIAFAAAAGLLLLITCTNVANLLLVRGIARVRELAVRLAIGATRTRIVLQLFTENALLAIAGGALGVAIAAGAVRLFIALAPPDVPRLDEVHLNAVALASALGITTIAIMLFGLAPAILASRLQLEAALRSDTRQSTTRSRIGAEALVAAQFALALLVLAGAGLVGRSLLNLQRAQLSLNPSRLLIGELALRSDLLASPEKQRAMLEQLIPQLEAIRGVRAVSPVVAVPFSGAAGWDGKPAAEGQSPEEAAANPMLNMEVVAPGYFTTLGVPVLLGRIFTDRDREDAPSVVVVSQSAARHYWPGDDPIGKRLMMGDDPERVFTVIGVVPDTRYRDLREARPSIYFPLSQSFFPFVPTTLAIGTDSPSAAPVSTIRRVISETAPGVALVSATSFGTFLEGPLAQPRMNAFLLAVFAAAAVTLASVGLFGVMATMVRQRTKELGIRLALGASPRDLERMVLRRGLTIGTVGLVVGLLGAFLANRLIAALLYEVSPTDRVTLVVAAALLVGIAGLASAVAARQSTRIDPLLVLRAD